MRVNWTLAFAPQGKSFLWGWEGDKKNLYTFFAKQDDRLLRPEEIMVENKPLFNLFSKEDLLFIEMGGMNGPFCLRALERGMRVYRIPSFHLVRISPKEVKVPGYGRKVEENRRRRARLLMELAQTSPRLFYPMLPPDEAVVLIKMYIQTYLTLQQRLRIPAQLRRVIMRIDFAWLPETNAKELINIRNLLANPADIDYYLKLEKQLLQAIKKELPRVPIWNAFLKDIPGIGPSLSARLIGTIEDIRRFPKRDSLRAYASWSVTPEGTYPRFRRGEGQGPKFNPELRQALFLVGNQIVWRGAKNPYNSLYYQKKAYYRNRDPEASAITCERRARRAAVSKFLDDFWKAWWRIVEQEGQPLPDSVRQVLYPVIPVAPKQVCQRQ